MINNQLTDGRKQYLPNWVIIRNCFGDGSDQLRDCSGADSVFLRLFFGYPSLIRERSLNEQPKRNRSCYEPGPKQLRRWDEWQPKRNRTINIQRACHRRVLNTHSLQTRGSEIVCLRKNHYF
jgi:hypothetical protein